MTNSIFFKISRKKNVACLRHSVAFSALAQRIKIPVRPGHPGGRCYKILRAYGSGFLFKINCYGIPQKVLVKLLLLNPRGQSTGLGLSLSYYIVKAHNGELKVTTKEGEGSEFLITHTVIN